MNTKRLLSPEFLQFQFIGVPLFFALCVWFVGTKYDWTIILTFVALLGQLHVVASFVQYRLQRKLNGVEGSIKSGLFEVSLIVLSIVFFYYLFSKMPYPFINLLYLLIQTGIHYNGQYWGLRKYLVRDQAVDLRLLNFEFKLIYLLPFLGFIFVFTESRPFFNGYSLIGFMIPKYVGVASVVTIGILLIVFTFMKWRKDEFTLPWLALWLSFLLLYFQFFLGQEELSHGYSVLATWHYLQYLIFIYCFNYQNFNQTFFKKWALIFTFILLPGMYYIFYSVVKNNFVKDEIFAPQIFQYIMALNFTHYLFDTLMWRRKESPLLNNPIGKFIMGL